MRQVARDLVKEARRSGVRGQIEPASPGMGAGVHDAGGMDTLPGIVRPGGRDPSRGDQQARAQPWGASWFSYRFAIRRSFWTVSLTSQRIILLWLYCLDME